MRQTIQTMQDALDNASVEIVDLTARNSNLDGDLRNAKAEIDRLKGLLQTVDGELAAMRREASLNAEILRLTRELMAARTGVAVPPTADPSDVMMLDGKPVSRKAVEEAAVHGLTNGFSSGGFIPAIKNVREQTGCGLREAKDFCDRHFSHLKDPARKPWGQNG